MATRFSAQMSGQMPGWPAAMRVMSRKPPAARRSRARCSSARSSARRIRVAAVRWGTWDTTATSASWRSGARATTVGAQDGDDGCARRRRRRRRCRRPGVSTQVRALEQVGPGAVDALQLGAGHGVAAHEAGVVHQLEQRRLHAADVGDQPGRCRPAPRATSSATAPTGVATKVISASGSVADRVEGPQLDGPRGHAPGRGRARSRASPARAGPGRWSRRSARCPIDLGAADARSAISASARAGRRGGRRRPRGRRGAARSRDRSVVEVHAGPGCSSGRGPVDVELPGADQRHVAQPDLAGRRGREHRVDVVGGGEQHADQVVVVDAVAARTSRSSSATVRSRICSAVSASTVVAPRRARTAVGMAGDAIGGAVGRAPRRPPGRRSPTSGRPAATAAAARGPAPRRRSAPATAPACSVRSVSGPMRVRTSRSTGWPTASHMRRTWRLRPSWMTSRTTPGATRATWAGAVDAVLELDALAQPAQRGPRSARPRPGPGTPSRPRSDGWVEPVGQLAVVGEQQQALGVEVEAAHREHPGLVGHQLDHGRPALGVVGGGDHAGRLVQQVVDEPGSRPRWARRRPRPGRASGSTRRPSTATSPLTVTRPSAIRSSHTRRLPRPARASTFWSRSPSWSCSPGTGQSWSGIESTCWLVTRAAAHDRGSCSSACFELRQRREASMSTRSPCSSASTTSAPGTKSATGGRSSSESRPSARGTRRWCRTARPGPGPGRGPTSAM